MKEKKEKSVHYRMTTKDKQRLILDLKKNELEHYNGVSQIRNKLRQNILGHTKVLIKSFIIFI